MADLCCNNVARNPTADKSEAKDPHGHPQGKPSDAEHSPTHPHKHRLDVAHELENGTHIRRCLEKIPLSDLGKLKMPDVPIV